MAEFYEDHFALVDQAVAAVVSGADRETVVHEVFYRLLADASLRLGFRGGSLSAWLKVVARNQAIDHTRRRRREVLQPDVTAIADHNRSTEQTLDQYAGVRLTLQRFREQVLPPHWIPVFNARFIEQQDQPTAARSLRMRRTTLAYQEYGIRKLLRKFVLKGERT